MVHLILPHDSTLGMAKG